MIRLKSYLSDPARLQVMLRERAVIEHNLTQWPLNVTCNLVSSTTKNVERTLFTIFLLLYY